MIWNELARLRLDETGLARVAKNQLLLCVDSLQFLLWRMIETQEKFAPSLGSRQLEKSYLIRQNTLIDRAAGGSLYALGEQSSPIAQTSLRVVHSVDGRSLRCGYGCARGSEIRPGRSAAMFERRASRGLIRWLRPGA